MSVNKNAKNRAMSIKQAWSVHIQLNHDKTKGQGTDYGCSNEVWYIEVLFLIFYCVPFNSKTVFTSSLKREMRNFRVVIEE